MVKLKVTARVIPEDTYLASVESSPPQNTPIRGEKRFIVIVRDPESWYIGTLALEIKRRYESLYKQDIGQIKYLKENEDDCDLDPELYVTDALVDEGKVLTDPSDQHVTIKVIQEQGRAVRQGSVIPDLSQVHYRLPERPARPPVPRFEDVGSALGKRKADGLAPRTNTEKKRTRLDEIEEEELMTSIEHDRPARSDIVVENSQPASTSPLAAKRRQTRTSISPELTWSFSNVGPPATGTDVSDVQHAEIGNQSHESQATTQVVSNGSVQPEALSKTPRVQLRSLNSPKANGTQTMSPLAAASSASRKFLKPRREVFAEPESDIDDSQMSPDSRDTSRITPRLVPSGIVNGAQRMNTEDPNGVITGKLAGLLAHSTGNDDWRNDQSRNDMVNHRSEGASSTSDEEGKTSNAEIASETKAVSRGLDKPSEVEAGDVHLTDETTTAFRNTGREQANTDITHLSNVRSAQSTDTTASSTNKHVVERSPQGLQKRLAVDEIQCEIEESGSEAASKSSETGRARSRKSRYRGGRTRDTTAENAHANVDKTASYKAFNPEKAPSMVDIGKEAEPLRNTRLFSTPAPDSPSEQLVRSLQESTHKNMSNRASARSVKGSAVSNAIPEGKKPIRRSRHRKSDLLTTDKKVAASRAENMKNAELEGFQSTSKATAESSNEPQVEKLTFDEAPEMVTNPMASMLSRASATNSTNGSLLSVPSVSQVAREASTDSHVTNSSKATILPPGITQEEYDRMIRANAHLNIAGLERPAKRKGTPSLRQTHSIKMSADKAAASVAKLNATAKTPVAKPAATQKKVVGNASAAEANTQDGKDSPVATTKRADSTATKKRTTVLESLTEASLQDNTKTPMPTKLLVKAPSLAPSESMISEGSKASYIKASLAAASKPSASVIVKTASQSSSNPAASASQKQATPTPSTVSKATSSTINNQEPKEPASSVPKSMLPPSSSSIAKDSAAGTPTPKPKARTIPTPKPSTTTTTKPAPKPTTTTTRLTVPPSFSLARNLQELRAMANSANNSTSNSPAPTTSHRFAAPKKGVLNDDSDSSSTSEDSDSDSESAPPPISTNKVASSASSAAKPAMLKSRPDPTIRDASNDESSEADDNDGDDD